MKSSATALPQRHTRSSAIQHTAPSMVIVQRNVSARASHSNNGIGAAAGAAASPVAPTATRSASVTAAGAAAGAAPSAAPRRIRFKLLPLVSRSVESSAQFAWFESVAGRSAMLGIAAAGTLEALTARSTFGELAAALGLAEEFAAALLASCGAAALLAVAAANAGGSVGAGSSAGAGASALGARVYEAVLSSLTAARRSSASVSGRDVDAAVDYVVESFLTPDVHAVFGAGDDGDNQ